MADALEARSDCTPFRADPAVHRVVPAVSYARRRSSQLAQRPTAPHERVCHRSARAVHPGAERALHGIIRRKLADDSTQSERGRSHHPGVYRAAGRIPAARRGVGGAPATQLLNLGRGPVDDLKAAPCDLLATASERAGEREESRACRGVHRDERGYVHSDRFDVVRPRARESCGETLGEFIFPS